MRCLPAPLDLYSSRRRTVWCDLILPYGLASSIIAHSFDVQTAFSLLCATWIVHCPQENSRRKFTCMSHATRVQTCRWMTKNSNRYDVHPLLVPNPYDCDAYMYPSQRRCQWGESAAARGYLQVPSRAYLLCVWTRSLAVNARESTS